MKVLFIMNPTSGRSSNDSVTDYIQQLATEVKGDFHIHYTSGKEDEEKIKKAVTQFQPERVAACGGDGTVQLVAQSLIDSNIPIGIVPLGSANGLAKALSLPRDYEEAIKVITSSPQVISMDLLKINDVHWCTHLADIGTNAILVKSYEEAGDKGMLGYAKHLIGSIQQSDLMEYQISTPDGTCSKEGYMLMIANAHKYGTGVQISEGSVSDGKFEICNVQKIDLESFIKAGLTAINIFVDKDMFSDVISCRQARINIKPQAHLQIDGEYIGEVTELKVEIVPSAIRVIING